MRITYIHQYFNTPDDSGGTRSYELARRLVERGHQVELITSDRVAGTGASASGRRTVESGISVHWIPVSYSNEMSFRRRMRAFGEFAVKATRVARRLPADVVFATSTPLTIGIPGVLAARAQRAPLVFEVRDLWPEIPIAIGAMSNPVTVGAARQLERWIYRHSARVVALSPGMAAGVAKTGFPDELISVIPNGCDLELFGSAQAEPFLQLHPQLRGKRLVVYPGTLGLVNEVDYLVRVAAAVRDGAPETAFVVVGEGAMVGPVTELARSLGVLDRNFVMLPPVPKRIVPSVLAAAHICVSTFTNIPELTANSANKFFDALAAGRPIAINYGGWQADLIEGRCGIRLSRDHAVAGGQLLALLQDDARREEMGRAALRLAQELFDRDDLATRLESVLWDAVADAGPSAR